MEKVIITVTKDGWKAQVHIKDKVFEENHKSTSTGSIGYDSCFEDSKEVSDNLLDALVSVQTGAYDVMKALRVK